MPSLNSIVPLIMAILLLILEIHIILKEKEFDSMKVSNLTYLKTFAVILEMVGSCLQVVEHGMD